VISLRQPIITMLGHVDAGKTSLLDKIRGTTVQLREVAGMIPDAKRSISEQVSFMQRPFKTSLGG